MWLIMNVLLLNTTTLGCRLAKSLVATQDRLDQIGWNPCSEEIWWRFLTEVPTKDDSFLQMVAFPRNHSPSLCLSCSWWYLPSPIHQLLQNPCVSCAVQNSTGAEGHKNREKGLLQWSAFFRKRLWNVAAKNTEHLQIVDVGSQVLKNQIFHFF